MKKTILTLLASSLLLPSLLAQTAGERDFSFLPEKIAAYGPSGEHVITREQTLLFLKKRFTPEQLKVMSDGEIRTAIRVLAVNRFERTVMERVLKEHGVTPDPERMEKELRNLHSSLPPVQRRNIEKQLLDAGSSFDAYLKKSVSDPDSVIRYAFIQWVDRDTADKISVTNDEAERFYRLHQSMFLVPETIVLSRILVPSEDDANALHTRLALGEKFTALAEGRGDKYGEFSRDDLDRELLGIVDPLKEGECSGVVRQKEGWAIFHVDARVPAAYVPLADIQGFIRNEIRRAKVLGEVQRIMYAERKRLNFELTL